VTGRVGGLALGMCLVEHLTAFLAGVLRGLTTVVASAGVADILWPMASSSNSRRVGLTTNSYGARKTQGAPQLLSKGAPRQSPHWGRRHMACRRAPGHHRGKVGALARRSALRVTSLDRRKELSERATTTHQPFLPPYCEVNNSSSDSLSP
jgi:hypothetical protein